MSSNGNVVAVGCDNGATTIVQLSQDVSTCNRNDRTATTNMFERETRRERALAAINKEKKLKEIGKFSLTRLAIHKKMVKKEDEDDDEVSDAADKDVDEPVPLTEEEILEKVEKEFFEIVAKEKQSRDVVNEEGHNDTQ